MIYVTKGKGPERERGKVLGFLEVSHQEGHTRDFISGDQWATKESDPESRFRPASLHISAETTVSRSRLWQVQSRSS